MRKKIEEDIKFDGIRIIKCTRPSLKSVTFWLTWFGAIVAMKMDERSQVDDGDGVSGILRCANRHNKNEEGHCCSAALRVKKSFHQNLRKIKVKFMKNIEEFELEAQLQAENWKISEEIDNKHLIIKTIGKGPLDLNGKK